MTMRNLLMVLAFWIGFVIAGEDPQVHLDNANKAKAEYVAKEKQARAKLLTGLKQEEKNSQNAGNLSLVLTIRTRIAELENQPENPFEQSQKIESNPVPNSPSEKNYVAEVAAAKQAADKKIATILAFLDQKRVALTKANKIEDALTIEGIMAAIGDISDNTNSIVGTWIKVDTKNEIIIRGDNTISIPKAREAKFLKGTWKLDDKKLTLDFAGTELILNVDGDKITGSWTLHRLK
jgi:hypothetical protein